jgi:hypothetical protein
MAPWTALLKEIIWCRSYIPIEEADSYTEHNIYGVILLILED